MRWKSSQESRYVQGLHQGYSLASTGQGFSSRNVPPWFSEGVSEYARFIILGEALFDRKLGSQYNPQIQAIIDNGLAGTDPYSGGAWALRYMDHAYGVQKIVALIKSPETSFTSAMQKELGVTVAEFENGLREWLKSR